MSHDSIPQQRQCLIERNDESNACGLSLLMLPIFLTKPRMQCWKERIALSSVLPKLPHNGSRGIGRSASNQTASFLPECNRLRLQVCENPFETTYWAKHLTRARKKITCYKNRSGKTHACSIIGFRPQLVAICCKTVLASFSMTTFPH